MSKEAEKVVVDGLPSSQELGRKALKRIVFSVWEVTCLSWGLPGLYSPSSAFPSEMGYYLSNAGAVVSWKDAALAPWRK